VPGAEKETVIQKKKKQDEKVHFEGSNAIREKKAIIYFVAKREPEFAGTER